MFVDSPVIYIINDNSLIACFISTSDIFQSTQEKTKFSKVDSGPIIYLSY